MCSGYLLYKDFFFNWGDSIIFFMIVGYLPRAMAFVMNDFMR